MPRKRRYLILLILLIVAFLFGYTSHAQTMDIVASITRTSGGGTSNFGRTGANALEVGFKYVAPASNFICSVTFNLSKTGNPTDDLIVHMFLGGTGNTGTLVVNSYTISGSLLTTSIAPYEFRWVDEQCHPTLGGETLWFTIERNGIADSTNYYNIDSPTFGESSTFPDVSISGVAWSDISGISGTNNRSFILYGVPDLDPRVYTPSSGNSWWDLSGAETFCNNAFPPASGASASWFNFNITNNLCLGVGFLFIPDGGTLSAGWASVSTDLFERAPFSYGSEMLTLFLSSDTATQSARFGMTLTMPLDILGVDTTISFAPLSSESVNTYAGDFLPTIRIIMEYILYISFGWTWYVMARNKLK